MVENMAKYIVKWRHIEDNEWHNFKEKAVFDNIIEAQEFIKQCEEEESGFVEFRIFELPLAV